MNKLLAPGPMVKGHAKLETTDCLKCHDRGKGVPDDKCLSCHDQIKPFVDKQKGFHGLAQKSCRECHSEHRGRDYDSLAVDESKFNHFKQTGYDLTGKHADIKCSECHKGKYDSAWVRAGLVRYFGNQATCVGCHKEDDVHAFKGNWAKKDCNACHSSETWKDGIQFDHKRDAKYNLEGKHAKLKCAECHGPGEKKKVSQYEWPRLAKQQCLTCHDDFHKDRLSKQYQNGKCATCHNQNKWTIQDFDHQVTGYPLRGKHFELKCLECHKQGKVDEARIAKKNFVFKGLKSQCLSCHEDYHRFGRLNTKHFGDANKCQACHTEKSWETVTKFDHNAHTRYPIDGKHMELDCRGCHFVKQPKTDKVSSIVYRWPKLDVKTCETCHQSPHREEFSAKLLKKACTECHVTSGWFDMKNKKGFDHRQTQFPLTGAHTKIQCSECHGEAKKQVFKFKSAALKFCIDCHSDIHQKQFSDRLNTRACAECHATTSFTNRLDFDHSQTRYPLQGAHEKVKCSECHTPTAQKISLTPPNISKSKVARGSSQIVLGQYKFNEVKRDECLQCHSDYHKGQLDQKCLNCHTVNSWKKVDFDHNTQSSFKLRHKHMEVKCSECHKPVVKEMVEFGKKRFPLIRYKPLNDSCVACHKDVHKGAFGSNCAECHVEKGWSRTRDFHKNFTLTGVHYSLNCAECHTDQGRRLSGMSQQCVACHAKDDVHSGALPNCGDCHRQQFWDVTGFKHSLTSFPLRGAHRTLDCMECHVTGTYKGLSRDCVSCHLQEALAVPAPNDHSGFININSCTDCHLNQFSWR